MGQVKKRCPHCDASMMVNYYSMNLTLLRALAKLIKHEGKPLKDMGLRKSEYANISKLKFWGFAVKHEDGMWTPTAEGKQFASGHTATDHQIGYFRNKVVERSGKIRVNEILKTEESKQKYREWMEPVIGEIYERKIPNLAPKSR